MVGERSTYAEVLGESDSPLALNKHLARYWAAADAPQDDPGRQATRSTTDPSTGAVAAVGVPVLETLRNIFPQEVGGEEERLQADNFREANGRDLAPDCE